MSYRREEDEQRKLSRRSFMEKALIGAGAVSAGAIVGGAGWVLDGSGPSSEAAPVAIDHSQHAATTETAAASPATQEHSAEEMDRLHKQGIDDFLKNQKTPLTKGKGNQPLQADDRERRQGVPADGATRCNGRSTPGKTAPARGYNAMLPGPLLRATEGDRCASSSRTTSRRARRSTGTASTCRTTWTACPYINQEPIKPGATFTYEFTLRNAGTHMYHSHHNSLDQVNRGLLGAFIVDPKDTASVPGATTASTSWCSTTCRSASRSTARASRRPTR